MKNLILASALLVTTQAWAAGPDLNDYCGKIHYRGDVVEVTVDGITHTVKSSEDGSVEEMKRKVPEGARHCVRVWQDVNNPTDLGLFDYFSYQARVEHARCVVTEMFDDSLFEESLSVDEYPDVDVYEIKDSDDASEIGLYGSMGSWKGVETKDGDSIKVVPSPSGMTIEMQYKGESDVFTITYGGRKVRGKQRGELRHNGDLVAKLKCDAKLN